VHVMDELVLPKIEDVEPRILRPHPQHAAAILIDREDGAAVEAMPVGVFVLEGVREASSAAVEVAESVARRHP